MKYLHQGSTQYYAVIISSIQVLEKYPVTTFCTSPTAYRMLVLEDIKTYDLTSLRHCVSAGEPLVML